VLARAIRPKRGGQLQPGGDDNARGERGI